MPNVLLTFEDLHAGDVVNGQYSANGVTISSADPHTPPMVFDTDHPTGGDSDLATNNLGNVLILSEDGDSSDPDDNAGGGTFVFEFDDPSEVLNFRALDVEEGGKVRLYDADGNLIKTVNIPTTSNNGQTTVHINADDVARMEVQLNGSGAIDKIAFSTPEPEDDADGIVSGTEGDDLIDTAYTGDPDGDMIDANDAILPGEAPQDDIVVAGDGDDTILSGEGNDEVFGQGGNDSIDGGVGDDIIYGDSGGAATVRESFDWEDLSDSEIDNGVAQNTGNVTVTYDRITDTGNHQSSLGDRDLNVSGIDSGGAPIDDDSSLRSQTNGEGNTGAFSWDFSDPVSNVSFNINDIDGDGVVRVTAFDADGNAIPVQLTGGPNLTLLDNDAVAGNDTADSNGGYSDPDTAGYNLNVSIPGPVSSIVVEHTQDGSNNSGIYVTEMFFDAPTGEDTGGDDTITGGEGADMIFGEAGSDVILGGNDGDVVDGGTEGSDVDVLDLRGEGPARIVNETVDADGDSTSGTVEFLDPDGNVTGSLTFTEIESVLLDPVDVAPVAVDDTATTDEDTSVTIDVLDNDTDANGDPLTVTDATVPADQGTVEIVGNQVVFTPAPDFNGDATITYTVEDPAGNSDTGAVDVTVTPVNDAPDAINDVAETDEEAPVTIDALDNDTDPDGDALTITAASVPAEQGTVAIVDSELVFTPADDFFGEATISYSITDGNGGTDVAEVAVTVNNINDAPVAVDDIVQTDEDTPVVVDLLGNDVDVDGDPLTLTSVTVPAEQGSVVDNGDGTVTFTPAPDFNGAAMITYTVDDGNGGTDEGEATVNVASVIDPPTANDDTATTDEDTPVTIDAVGNDTDADGDPLTITAATVPADQGSVEIVGNELLFTPAENFNGEATITYSIDDGMGGTDSAEVVVTVNPVNDDPVAVDDIENTDEDVAVVVDLLGNDVDADGDPLTLGTVTVDPAQGSFVDNGDGTVTFTPAPDFNGPATIIYTVEDGQGGTDEGEATVNVGAVNDSPVAVDDSDTTDEDTPVTVDLLANDSDPDGDPLSVISATVPVGQGTLVNNGDGTVTFTPAPDFNGEAVISYTISDGNGLTSSADHTITVTPVNDDPVAVDDAAETPFDTPVTVDVAGNDTDVDGDPLTVTEAASDDGSVDINPDGTVTFTPNPGFEGPATITYTVSDGQGGTDEGELIVTVGEQPLDGIVQGTTGDDLIDTAYMDDPQGDMIDNNDEILPGEGPQDDIVVAGDGDDTVLAGEGDDEVYGEDGNDELNGEDGDDYLSGGEGDDTLRGGDGDDVLDAGQGDDELFGEDGNDTLLGGPGTDLLDGGTGDDVIVGANNDDVIFGRDGNDDIEGNEGDDNISGGAGDDTIDAGDGDDTVLGGSGDDQIDLGEGDDVVTAAGSGDDTVLGGLGNDDITTNDGSDSVEGGDGDDVINTSGHSPLPDLGYPGLFPSDPNPNDDRDFVDGGDGNDVISTGDDADTIIGGSGNDTIDGGLDADDIDGGDGDDRIVGGEGSDTINAGDGDDLIYAGIDPDLGLPDNLDIADEDGDLVPNNGQDVVNAGDGNDTIFGADDDDVLNGEAGDDVIDGGVDDDLIDGGTGNDTLTGGQGADTVSGGDDRDTILVGSAEDGIGDVIDGGTGSTAPGDVDDFDLLDLTGSGPLRIVGQTTDADGNSTSGTVEFLDGVGGDVIGTLQFSEIEQIVPCFTPGTSIATPRGEILVEDLMVGDKIITRDNGIQEIRWIGAKRMDGRELQNNPHLQPVLIQKGSLGNGLPERDMLVSPNHRMLVGNDRVSLYFEETEVLVAAKHLVNPGQGVQAINSMGTTYIHFMFDAHEVVLSNGAWTESFQPGDYTLKGIGNAQRNEIFEMFPELQGEAGREAYASARLTLKKHEAKLLFK